MAPGLVQSHSMPALSSPFHGWTPWRPLYSPSRFLAWVRHVSTKEGEMAIFNEYNVCQ